MSYNHASNLESVLSEGDSPTKSTLYTPSTVSHIASFNKSVDEDDEDSRTKVTLVTVSTGALSYYQSSNENPSESALKDSRTKEQDGGKMLASLPSFKCDDSEDHDDENQCTVMQRQYLDSKLGVISNVVFVVASGIYVASEVTFLPYYQFYQGVPYNVREAETGDVWWRYYNETDAFPDYLNNATDDYAWNEWFNNSFFDDTEIGEFLFRVPNADRKYENPEEEYGAWVSQYMILYFCAALGFLVTGSLMVYISRGCFWSMIFYGIMIVAALFGIAASCFVNKDPSIESILNFISVHLFALEAIVIMVTRCRRFNQQETKVHHKGKKDHRAMEFTEWDTCLGLPKIAWLVVGDISLFIGTFGDVVLSYFYMFEQDYLEQAIASIVTASFWLLAALVYTGVSSVALHRTKKMFKEAGLHEKHSDVRKVQLIIFALIVLAVVIIVLGVVFGVDPSEDEVALIDEGTFAPSDISTYVSTDISTDVFLDTQSPAGACSMTMSTFSQSTTALTMAVMSSITAIEIQYVANVFAKTFEALIYNKLEQAESNYCDPYCRNITQVSVIQTETSNIFEAAARQSTDCDIELTLTLQVEGTYWTCEGYLFPGLFLDTKANIGDAVNTTSDVLSREMNGDEMCQICPEESTSDGLVGPSSSDLLAAMKPYVTLLDPICDLLTAEVLENGK